MTEACRDLQNLPARCGAKRDARRLSRLEVDLRDGFIHFSTAEQAVETAAKHFAGQRDLVLLAVEADALGDALKWEPSRGGALFPHLYAPLDLTLVLQRRAAAARRGRAARVSARC